MQDENLNDEISLEEAEVQQHALRGLVASEGWKMYCSIIEKQQVVRFNQIVLKPLSALDETLEQEYVKGEIAGMRMSLQMPQMLLSTLTEQIASLRQARDAEPAKEQK